MRAPDSSSLAGAVSSDNSPGGAAETRPPSAIPTAPPVAGQPSAPAVDRAVPGSRPMRGSLGRSGLSPGGLYVGARGEDAAGWVYRLVAPLDRGGMGELFVAEVSGPPNAPRHAVVKRLLPELMDDPDYVAMFRSEAEIMAQLDHPSVVRVLGMPVLEGAPCLALEFVNGRSAQQLVSRGRDLGAKTPPSIAAYITARVAEALDHVHHARDRHGHPLELVHRDVTPGNVLIDFDGAVKLTDFGIAKSRMSAVSTTVGIVKGKARYLAPEQILGRPATPQSDLFSSALVLVEMLTGEPLFERGSIPKTLFAIVHGERPPMRELLPSAALPLAALLEQALATAPEHRPTSGRDYADELERLTSRLGPPVDPEALGQHLRGIFTGTRGPLTRALKIPPLALPQARAGAAPLDPETFGDAPAPGLDDSASDPLAGLEEGETARTPRSAPQEMDEALSVLAWLQSQAPPPSEEVRTVFAAPARQRSRLGVFVVGLGLGGVAVALTLLTAWHLGIDLGPPLTPPRRTSIEALPPVATEAPGGPAATRSQGAVVDRAASPPPPAPAEPSAEEDKPDAVALGPSFRLPPLEADAFVGPAEAPPPPPPPPPPAPATLDVLRPRRARVWVDGLLHPDRVPFRGARLTPGKHTVMIRLDRYQRVYELRVESKEKIELGRDLRRKGGD